MGEESLSNIAHTRKFRLRSRDDGACGSDFMQLPRHWSFGSNVASWQAIEMNEAERSCDSCCRQSRFADGKSGGRNAESSPSARIETCHRSSVKAPTANVPAGIDGFWKRLIVRSCARTALLHRRRGEAQNRCRVHVDDFVSHRIQDHLGDRMELELTHNIAAMRFRR